MPFPSLHRLQGLVGKPIGLVILLAPHMLNRERFQARDHLLRPLMQGLQCRTLHLIDALDLGRQQLGVRLHVNAQVIVAESIFEGGEKSLVFSDVIGSDT